LKTINWILLKINHKKFRHCRAIPQYLPTDINNSEILIIGHKIFARVNFEHEAPTAIWLSLHLFETDSAGEGGHLHKEDVVHCI